MRILLGGIIFLFICLVGISAQAQNPWVLYDNFNSEFLDIAKWRASESRTGGVVVLEEVREIEGQRLYMLTRAHGPTTQTGFHRGDKSVAFLNPNSILGIKASIKVNAAEITQCPGSGAESTRARARFSGSFFNTGACTSPSGQECDVAAQILIQRYSNSPDKPGILRILGEVFECTETSCFSITNYQSVELGTIRLGQWATVSVEWNNADNQFIFQLDKETPKVIYYDMDDTYLPNSPFKLLGVSPRIRYCGSERQVGLIGADFENVFVK